MKNKFKILLYYCAIGGASNLDIIEKKITKTNQEIKTKIQLPFTAFKPKVLMNMPKFQGFQDFSKSFFEEGTNFDLYHVSYTLHPQKLVNIKAPKGGMIRFTTVSSSFCSLNPFVSMGFPPGLSSSRDAPGTAIATLMMRCWECPFHMIPYCAHKIRKAKDNSWITFYINPKARFHDGRPITAQDIQATFTYLCRYGSVYRKHIGKKISRIYIKDEKTITFYIHPLDDAQIDPAYYDPEFPLILAELPVLSEQDIRHRNGRDHLMQPLMGSGPYRLSIHTDHMTLYEKVPDFWGKDLPQFQGISNVDKLQYKRFLTKETAFAAFRKGEIDVWVEDNPHEWENYAHFPHQASDIQVHQIIHNKPIGMMGFFLNTRLPLFQDIRVRQGIKAILDLKFSDFQRILGTKSHRIESFFQGTPYAAAELLTPQEQEAILTLPVPITDIRGPKLHTKHAISNHFKRSGWRLKNHVLQKNGVCMSFVITVKGKEEKVWAGRFSIYLKNFGIHAQVKEVDEAAYYQKISQKDFDVVVAKRAISRAPGAEQLYYWTSPHGGPKGKNYSGIQDPNVDFSCKQMILCLNNKEKYRLWLCVLDRILKLGCYVIPLHYYDTKIIAHWKHIGVPASLHHDGDFSPVTSYWSIPKWYP